MNTTLIAETLVGLLQQGQFEEAQKTLFAQNVVSIEPEAAKIPIFNGLDSIIKKGQEFRNSVQDWHRLVVSTPVVSKDFFSIALLTEVTYTGQEEPTVLDEVIVYQVEDGKITQERFFY